MTCSQEIVIDTIWKPTCQIDSYQIEKKTGFDVAHYLLVVSIFAFAISVYLSYIAQVCLYIYVRFSVSILDAVISIVKELKDTF